MECYRLSRSLPSSETYGLASQIQRAAVSVPANIAEGHGRDHLNDYTRHLSIAKRSLMELETHLAIVQRLSYLPEQELRLAAGLATEIGKMLEGCPRI